MLVKYVMTLTTWFLLSNNAFATTYPFESSVVLHGKIMMIKSLHPSAQFSGGKQPAIVLNQRIIVEDSNGQIKTKLIQLISSNHILYSKLFKNNGKNITVTCNKLFRAETAHHTTKVICNVNRVQYQ
ncbi:DUF4431 domain-containing protein [Acinetobacter qingfengensis]|nr:DUF4431 domain-containing protein [Acinetobacter qingfengensis]